MLADSAMRTVTATPNMQWGIGRLDKPYRGEVAWGGSRADYYRVNLGTGERTLIAKGLTRTMGTSPDSRWFLFLEKGKVYAFNLETGARVQVDASAKRSFVDAEDDHPYELPTYGVAGWSKDGPAVSVRRSRSASASRRSRPRRVADAAVHPPLPLTTTAASI